MLKSANCRISSLDSIERCKAVWPWVRSSLRVQQHVRNHQAWHCLAVMCTISIAALLAVISTLCSDLQVLSWLACSHSVSGWQKPDRQINVSRWTWIKALQSSFFVEQSWWSHHHCLPNSEVWQQHVILHDVAGHLPEGPQIPGSTVNQNLALHARFPVSH